jgi:hypothetical protein
MQIFKGVLRNKLVKNQVKKVLFLCFYSLHWVIALYLSVYMMLKLINNFVQIWQPSIAHQLKKVFEDSNESECVRLDFIKATIDVQAIIVLIYSLLQKTIFNINNDRFVLFM